MTSGNEGHGWDPGQYLKFSDERLRPGFDLMAQIGDLPEGPMIDLGCGTGVHARALAARWPGRESVGLDQSEDMLREAGRQSSPVTWIKADLRQWEPAHPFTLIFSNAALQWIEDHQSLFPRLFSALVPGGVLAVQMPCKFGGLTHQLMYETAREGAWAATLAPVLWTDPVASPETYYDLLAKLAPGGIDIWQTEYLHVLQGKDPVLEWLRGTALRPLLAALEPDQRAAFGAAFGAKLRSAFPARKDGRTLLPFRRIFIVARRRAA